jgi:hypothetical protein
MTKLHDLKIKYEQSQLAERVALDVYDAILHARLRFPSTVPYSVCEDVYEELLEAESVRMTAQANYEDELNRRWRVVGRVSMLVGAACLVYLIVWSMT